MKRKFHVFFFLGKETSIGGHGSFDVRKEVRKRKWKVEEKTIDRIWSTSMKFARILIWVNKITLFDIGIYEIFKSLSNSFTFLVLIRRKDFYFLALLFLTSLLLLLFITLCLYFYYIIHYISDCLSLSHSSTNIALGRKRGM